MSVELIVEVLTHAPASLNPTERLTLVVIAESCRTESRMTYYRDGWNADDVARRVGITPESLTKVFRSLARKGYEVRVAHAFKDGKPVFAFKGKQTTFRLPRLAPQSLDESPPFAPESLDEDPVSDPQSPNQNPGFESKGWTSVRQSLDESPGNGGQSLDESPPLLLKDLPSKIPQSLSPQDQPVGCTEEERENEASSQDLNEVESLRPEQKLIAKRGVSGDAVDYVCGWIDCRFAINGLGWWYTADRNGSLDQHIAEAMTAYAADPYSPAPQAAHVPGSGYRPAANEIRSPADQRVADAMPLYEKYRALEQRERAANSRSVPELAAQKWAPTTSQ